MLASPLPVIWPAGIQIPVQLAQHTTAVDSRYAEACVALDTGEAWCGAYRSSYYKCSDYPEYDGELRIQGDRETVWCLVRREPRPIVSVSADGCLLEADSKLFCWLYDSIGYPVGDQAIKAFTGLEHRCVVTMHGDVGCWGDGTYGQLGYMGEYWSTEPDGDSPSEEGFRHPQVPKHFLRLPSAAKTIEVKVNSTCALLENGQIWCWGKFELPLASTRSIENYEERLLTMRDDSGSFYKQIGESTLPNSPIELPPGCKAQAFSYSTSLCALCSPGCWKCWNSDISPAEAQCVEF